MDYINRTLPVLVALLACSLITIAQEVRRIPIPFNNNSITIDGVLNEWPEVPTRRFRTTSINAPNPNWCDLFLLWDAEYLYCGAYITDNFLVGLEKPADIKRIHYNDSFEIYIDSQNDSKDTIDINDYQFIIEIKGGKAIFRGDRLNLKLKHLVPKESGIANIIFKSAVGYSGTLNNNQDSDSHYVVECKIPWASIGIDPVKGYRFKADFCVNDNDTVVDFRQVNSLTIKQYTNTSMLGYHNFGYPNYWAGFELTGSPGRIKKTAALLSDFFMYPFLLLLLTTGLLLYYAWLKQKPEFLRQRVVAASRGPADMKNHDRPVVPVGKPPHPYVARINEYIDNNLDQQICINSLSEKLNISNRQLQRFFRDVLNTTPTAYIAARKLNQASRMFEEKYCSINEIAYKLGYTDPSYFSKVFKNQFGITPKEYRKRIENRQAGITTTSGDPS